MKRMLSIAVALLALHSPAALAAPGVNLRWSFCLADGGVSAKTFACNTNAGLRVLVGAFELPADLPGVIGTEGVVDLASAGPSLPSWWQFFNPGVCRRMSLAIAAADNTNCPDWAEGQAAMRISAYQVGLYGANTARIVTGSDAPPLTSFDLHGVQQYCVFSLLINSASTVGSGACDGCLTPVCIVFNSLRIIPGGGAPPDVVLTAPTNGTDGAFVTWQGGGGITVGDKIGCPAATPVRNSTWGSVKALYR